MLHTQGCQEEEDPLEKGHRVSQKCRKEISDHHDACFLPAQRDGIVGLIGSKICHFLPCNACMDCVNTATPIGTISCDDDLDEFDSSSSCDCSSLESGKPTPSLSKDDEDYDNVNSDLTMYNADGTPHVVTVQLSTDQELRETILKKENNLVPQPGMWIEPNVDSQEDNCSGKMNF